MKLFGDPVINPFNEWLRTNGVWVAVGVAIVLLTMIIVVYIQSKNKKR